MEIVGIETYRMQARIEEPLGWAYNWTDTRHGLLVKVVTDEGIYGWGECHLATAAVQSVLEDVLKPLLLGRDPLDVEQLWTHMYHRTKRFGQKGIVVMAIGALDVALWDIAGKYFNVPIHRLLGGRSDDRVQAYATGLYFKDVPDLEEALCAEARLHVAEGFKAVKMKAGHSPERDLMHVRAVREAVGPDIKLMVDANFAYDAVTAVSLGRKLEKLGVYWFEEPVSPEDVEGYAEVARALDMAVAGGESEYTRYGFQKLIASRAVDIVQPDIITAGGLSECRKIATMADAWGLRCFLHVWGSAIALAAGIHFTAAQTPHTPALNCPRPMLELDRTPNPLRDTLTIPTIKPVDGFLPVPQEPGLGVEVNMDIVERYRVG